MTDTAKPSASTPDRRSLLVGAGAALASTAAGPAFAQRKEPTIYDYLMLNLAEGETTRAAFAEHLKSRIPDIKAAGGELLGMFAPQLGWSSVQTAVVVRWLEDTAPRDSVLRSIARTPTVINGKIDVLNPTLRPGDTDLFKSGGIFVHRWFDVDTVNVPEFVDLSGKGWPDFETRFDSRVFGLFTAAQRQPEKTAGLTRMLLITRYGSHGIWQDSRDPSTEAMGIFMRRRQLAHSTTAASTLFVPVG